MRRTRLRSPSANSRSSIQILMQMPEPLLTQEGMYKNFFRSGTTSERDILEKLSEMAREASSSRDAIIRRRLIKPLALQSFGLALRMQYPQKRKSNMVVELLGGARLQKNELTHQREKGRRE
jgi:hypothetical protein